MIRTPQTETMARPDLEGLQLERLKKTVSYVYERVPFYKNALKKNGVAPEDIKTLKDLVRLPFTSKLDFRDNYPFGLTCVPRDEIVRVHSSSGTTGKPVIAPYTQKDVDVWAELIARSLACAGMTREDVLQNAYGYGLFTGGLGLHYGAERLGATVVPASTGNTKRQLMLLQDLGTTAISCTPSYALILHETALEMGIDIRKTALRLGILGAEPWSENMRIDIENKLGITPSGFTGSPKSSAPGWLLNAPIKPACTYGKTTSWWKSLTHQPASNCLTARKENWSSPPSIKKHSPYCASEQKTSPA